MKNEASFQEFAAARTPALLRAAFLLCGNHHEAEDLVQETLAKLYVVWGRKRLDNPVAYARTTLTRTFVSSRRKLSSTERPSDTLLQDARHRSVPPDGPAQADVDLHLDLVAQLRLLAPLDRAVLVLRYLDDASVRETADAVGVSEQVVRTRSLRALKRIRGRMDEGVLAGPTRS